MVGAEQGGAGTGTYLGQVPRSLTADAPGAPGEGSSFYTLGLAEDFGSSFLQRCWTLQFPVHPGGDNGQPAGLGPGDKLGERQSRAGQGQMASVEADFPTSNCFCYLIMSQAGKHPPPRLVSLGPPLLQAQGKFPGTKIRLPDATSDFSAPTRILQTATPGQLFRMGMGDGAR